MLAKPLKLINMYNKTTQKCMKIIDHLPFQFRGKKAKKTDQRILFSVIQSIPLLVSIIVSRNLNIAAVLFLFFGKLVNPFFQNFRI